MVTAEQLVHLETCLSVHALAPDGWTHRGQFSLFSATQERDSNTDVVSQLRLLRSGIWQTAGVAQRLAKQRQLAAEGHLTPDEWAIFAGLDVVAFHAALGIAFDAAAGLVLALAGVSGPMPFDQLYEEREPEQLGAYFGPIDTCLSFREFVSVREGIGDRGPEELVIPLLEAGITFQWTPSSPPIDFQHYVARHYAQLVFMLETIAEIWLSNTDITAQLRREPASIAGLKPILQWVGALVAVVRQ